MTQPQRDSHTGRESLVQRAPFSVAAICVAGVSMVIPWGAVLTLVALALGIVAKRRAEPLGTVALGVAAVAVLLLVVVPLALGEGLDG